MGKVYSQGDPADSVFYIQKGKIKVGVVSPDGKEAVLGILGPHEFFGEGVLAGQTARMGTAIGLTDCHLIKIQKSSMLQALHRHKDFADLFRAHLISRNARYAEDLVDHHFNKSEKRLARILLRLAGTANQAKAETVVPKLSQEMLAQMIGTTRSRVSYFMNKFRKLGLIEYGRELKVHASLLSSFLRD
jgi:CRP/FNR family transcriptional regulator, cyclic AMP receptor protein